ncbi:hypothetical protein MAC_03223 [Metarhizium acridum CQMa 102]|uniref:ATP-dependent DNA helicase PIF1 n=1 Tax=Metarhizium acridum (strain CQMa 102) TaxID=655827 RepID=E9E042_METAQ|nr:uncharacterized protein MAC_03223 [Metarhizium acridum CQMa 102]EFY90643.1 hypothetical protein MAC_03223 [Metarhizium acridum CQMa 102]
MASPVVDIDPYGEVFIVIPTAVTRPQAGLANEEIIAPLESVEGQDRNSLPADRSENDDSDKVRAKKMYGINCKESTPDENGNFHWHFEPIFNRQAFEMVMDIIHGQTHKTPDRVSLDMMADVAAITDDLQCHNAVKFVANAWMDRLQASPPKKICSDLYKWILIAWVFDQPDLFQSTTRLAIMECTGTLSPEAVESMRVELLSELIAGVERMIDDLSRGHSTCTFECRSMWLGALIQEMRSNGLSSPDPSELKQDLSLTTTLGIIRNFQSPVIFSPRSKFADVADGYENHDPNTLWKLQWGLDEDNYGYSFSKKSKIHKKAASSTSFHMPEWNNMGPTPRPQPTTLMVKSRYDAHPPIQPATPRGKKATRHTNKCANCRISFPEAFDVRAITVHKAQGLTLKQVVLNLDRRDHAPGLSYVAISRVKKLSSIMFETPFDLSRFTTKVTTELEHEG